jgi:hypothetical protein
MFYKKSEILLSTWSIKFPLFRLAQYNVLRGDQGAALSLPKWEWYVRFLDREALGLPIIYLEDGKIIKEYTNIRKKFYV